MEALEVNLTNEIECLGKGKNFDVHDIYQHICKSVLCSNVDERLNRNLILYRKLPENECNWSVMQRTQTHELMKLSKKMESEVTCRLKKTLPENEKECL